MIIYKFVLVLSIMYKCRRVETKVLSIRNSKILKEMRKKSTAADY